MHQRVSYGRYVKLSDKTQFEEGINCKLTIEYSVLAIECSCKRAAHTSHKPGIRHCLRPTSKLRTVGLVRGLVGLLLTTPFKFENKYTLERL